eukprot:585880-Rhodomonas_salina.2
MVLPAQAAAGSRAGRRRASFCAPSAAIYGGDAAVDGASAGVCGSDMEKAAALTRVSAGMALLGMGRSRESLTWCVGGRRRWR